MHIVVSWDINDPASRDHNRWTEELRAVIQPYSWVRPLTTLYVIQVANAYERQIIVDGLTRISNRANGMIHVLISPPMVGGAYGGVLPQNLWAELNARSQ